MTQFKLITISNAAKALDVIQNCRGIYPKAAVEYLLSHREEALPELRQMIREVGQRPAEVYTEGRSIAFGFALHFLSVFGDSDVHAELLAFLRRGECLDPYLGDMLTEDMPMVLHRSCGGCYEGIWDLAWDRNADEYCRLAALDALVFGVHQGELPSEEVVDRVVAYLESNLRGPAEYCDYVLIDGLTALLFQLGERRTRPLMLRLLSIAEEPWELEHRIQDLAAKHDDYFAMVLERRYRHLHPENFIDRVGWWGIFRDPHKTPRNEPCPCGSGTKYKKCCFMDSQMVTFNPPWSRLV